MSMQQTDAGSDRMREIMTDGAPPPSAGALNHAVGRHAAEKRRSQAAARRREEVAEAIALGVAVVVKQVVDRSWSDAEDDVLRALCPHLVQARERLPHRSPRAVRDRAVHLGLMPSINLWSALEVVALRRLWGKATPAELAAALPRWDSRAIKDKARRMGLKLRGRPPLHPTGDPLCDAIRDRCRVLGYSMAYLDRIAASGTYFQTHEWKGKGGHRPTPMIRAVRALGGELRVEWPD